MVECRNIDYWKNEIFEYDRDVFRAFKFSENRIELSEEILNGMRNFCESVACLISKVYDGNKKYEKRYTEIEKSIDYCKKTACFNFISVFRDNLNSSIGHKRFHVEYAERLTLKYIDYLLKIKELLKDKFDMNIFETLNLYPFDMDESFRKYYIQISNILNVDDLNGKNGQTDIYYIYKKKMIYINGKRFYEYTISNALDKSNKNNNFLVFSLLDIPTNYAVNLTFIEKTLNYFGINIDCSIIIDFQLAIRACEIEKLGKIVGVGNFKYSKTADYRRLMNYLKEYNTNIAEIVKSSEEDYKKIVASLFGEKRTYLYLIITLSRKKYKQNVTGVKTLLYLLYRTNNLVIRKQLPDDINDKLSNMYLSKKTYSFELAPFSSWLSEHKPKLNDLINLFNLEEHKQEYIADKIYNLSNQTSCIYLDTSNFNFPNIDSLIDNYSSHYNSESLIPRKILKQNNNYYLNSNEINTVKILRKIKEYCNKINILDYEAHANAKISKKNIHFEDVMKEKALKELFENGSIYAVYGPAGTGKSYFAGLALSILDDLNKVCIAATNPAVENMKRKFSDNTAKYMTITKFLNEYNGKDIDFLVIDECSTVSADDMCKILYNTNPKLILLLGDFFQIQPIKFGNWFALMREFIDEKYFVELSGQFRTDSEILKPLWEEVRKLNSSNSIIEKLSMYKISHVFDSSIFCKNHEDEIILCLNYDGLYGINNFNKVLQKNNPEKEYRYKQFVFKKNDPIIFEDTIKFKGLFYNNLKGKILDIEEYPSNFKFTIKVYTILNSISCKSHNVEFIKNDGTDTIVSFFVEKMPNEAYDNDTDNISYFPFQVAYAMSIHKSQGLEYDSVKIIISNEVEENITHNVFYTAITRAKKNLTIYWTIETENKVINGFKLQNYKKDATIIKSKYSDLKKK